MAPNDPNELRDSKTLRDLFDRYVIVWVWSIFIGINTALSYNIFNLYSPSKWGKLNIVIILIYLIAAFTALFSWFYLFRFFGLKILPIMFGRDHPSEESSRDMDRKAYFQLRSAFYFMLYAICFRFFIPIIEMIFSVFYQ